MAQKRLPVRRDSLRLNPDPERVITRFLVFPDHDRIRSTAGRVMGLSEQEVLAEVRHILSDYSQRHKHILHILMDNYQEAAARAGLEDTLSRERKLLLGAYFTMEYAVESTALFNPSLVPSPNQAGLRDNQLRCIVSLRAVGEGHVSSIEFREAVIHDTNSFLFEPINRYVQTAHVEHDPLYTKELFIQKLLEMNLPSGPRDAELRDLAGGDVAEEVMDSLGDQFAWTELRDVVEAFREQHRNDVSRTAVLSRIMWLTHSNYTITFDENSSLSERVIFPVSENESRGIEDARFVRFVDGDGDITYYATYTAYNGFTTLSQILETKDFRTFSINTLNGPYSQSKGMALFPRRINGRYAMIARVDGENLFYMDSEDLHFWYEARFLRGPQRPWEYLQIGNCGSPIETEEGWLLLTHGVGPMRRYGIGAVLLDLDDPTCIIGDSVEPLLTPEEEEREGYVPNVVYSCGALIHNDELIIPYAMSDTASRIATIPIKQLLRHLKPRKGRHKKTLRAK